MFKPTDVAAGDRIFLNQPGSLENTPRVLLAVFEIPDTGHVYGVHLDTTFGTFPAFLDLTFLAEEGRATHQPARVP